MSAEVATAENLVKVYWSASGEVQALRGVDLTLAAGQLTAVVGPSGSGKSSLLRILGCMDRPTAGTVTVAGEVTNALGERALRRLRRRAVGYVYQRPSDNLAAQLTVRQHLAHAASVAGARRAEADELLELLDLAGRARHRPDELSGGEQQRLAFARAALGRPALLVADEPTAELDSASAARLLGTLRPLCERGTAVLLSTHDEAARHVADRVLSLRHGALLTETQTGEALTVIDSAGRVQLPPEALALFPDRRATLQIGRDGVRLRRPGGADA